MKLNMWRRVQRYRGYCLFLFPCLHMHSAQRCRISFPIPHFGAWRRKLLSATILALPGCIMNSSRLKLITAQTRTCFPRANPVLEAEEVPQWKCSQYSSHNRSWCPAIPIHTACTMFPSPGSFKATLHAARLIAYVTPLTHISVPISSLPLPSLHPYLPRYWTTETT